MHSLIVSFDVLFAGFLFLLNFTSFAQEVAMADSMRGNGKIYVVVAVCLTILIGLFIYVVLLDKKITDLKKIENKYSNK